MEKSLSGISPDIRMAVEVCAYQYSLPLPLVLAICDTESRMNPWAMRYEPGYRWLVGDKLTMTHTELVAQKCSWGLMQVMGAVAREYGFTGWLSQLCQPDLGVNYGCRHLKKFWDRYENWHDAIASYNAGRPVKQATGEYLNQVYVDTVHAAWNRFGGQAAQL